MTLEAARFGWQSCAEVRRRESGYRSIPDVRAALPPTRRTLRGHPPRACMSPPSMTVRMKRANLARSRLDGSRSPASTNQPSTRLAQFSKFLWIRRRAAGFPSTDLQGKISNRAAHPATVPHHAVTVLFEERENARDSRWRIQAPVKGARPCPRRNGRDSLGWCPPLYRWLPLPSRGNLVHGITGMQYGIKSRGVPSSLALAPHAGRGEARRPSPSPAPTTPRARRGIG